MKLLTYLAAGLFFTFALYSWDRGGDNSTVTDSELLGNRPFDMHVPASYDASTPAPLIVVLHGLGSNGAQILSYFGLRAASERHGFLVAFPDGTRDSFGRKYWNATDACCASGTNFEDDVRYLSLVLDIIESRLNVDNKQIFFIGHSNGAYMSHRMACDRSTRVAAIVSLAGVSWNNLDKCQTQEPVNVLQVHGDHDGVILYNGGIRESVPYPSAVDTVSDWANRNGCTGSLVESGSDLNVDVSIPGNETRVQSFTDCPSGGEAELWTIQGGSHGPNVDDSWSDLIWAFFSSHPKP